MRKVLWPIVAILFVAAVLIGGVAWFGRAVDNRLNPQPETIVAASLQGLREQNRLSAFVARYVAVVTSTQQRFGLSARKTLIMPGTVRYEVDLAKLGPRDVRWDASSGELLVTLPPMEVTGPQVDLTQLREYDGGGLLMAVTDTEKVLDSSNRRAGQVELLRQAREPVPMNLAKDATRRAIEHSFALPLRAAGLTAEVRVRFPDEPDFPRRSMEQIDRSRSLEDVYGTANAATEG